MTCYFAFKPADTIIQLHQQYLTQIHAPTGDLYPLRDDMTLRINDAVINATMVQLIEHFPDSEEKQSLLKAAHFCQSTSSTLLRQILNKVSNEEAMPSLTYLNDLFRSFNGESHISFPLPDTLASGLLGSFSTIIAGSDTPELRGQLTAQMHQFAQLAVEYLFDGFMKTLKLGLVKRKACDFARAGIMKILSIAINHLVPKIGRAQMLIFAKHYQQLFIQS